MNRVPEKVAMALALTAFESGMFYGRFGRLPSKADMRGPDFTRAEALPAEDLETIKAGFQYTLNFICEGLDK